MEGRARTFIRVLVQRVDVRRLDDTGPTLDDTSCLFEVTLGLFVTLEI